MKLRLTLMIGCLSAAIVWATPPMSWADADGGAKASDGAEPGREREGGRAAERERSGEGDRAERRERLKELRERRGEGERPGVRDLGPRGERERGPGMGRHGPFDGRGPFAEIDEQDVPRLLEVLDDLHPEMAAHAREGLKRNPARARVFLGRLWDRMRPLADLRRDDPEMYRLRIADHRHELATRRLLMGIRRAKQLGEDEKARELVGELRGQLDDRFEVRHKLRERELADLERRVQELRKELARHRADKRELIEQALARYLDGRGDDPMGPSRSLMPKPPRPPRDDDGGVYAQPEHRRDAPPRDREREHERDDRDDRERDER